MDPLQDLFQKVKGTHDPAAGGANELLIQLVRRGRKGFRFVSLDSARCNSNVALLLDMELAVWEQEEFLGVPIGGKLRLSPSVEQTLIKS